MEELFDPSPQELNTANQTKLDMQFGDHDAGLIKGSLIESLAEVHRGNLDIHAWDTATRNRVNNNQPECLVIESIHLGDFNHYSSELLWYLMPDRPNKLNIKGEAQILAGDVRLSYLLDPSPIRIMVDEAEIGRQILGGRIARVGDSLLLYAAALGISIYAFREQKISRREFLFNSARLAVFGGASYIGAKIGLPFLHTSVTDPELYEYVLAASEVLRPYASVGFQWASDARTAVVAAKSLGHGIDKTTTLFGSSHSEANVSRIQSDQGFRKELIKNYYQNSIGIIKGMAKRFPELNNDDLVDKLRLSLISYDVAKVVDPGRLNSLKNLAQCFQYLGRYKSDEIVAALNWKIWKPYSAPSCSPPSLSGFSTS